MLFTWDATNLCVVFRWWHIRSTSGLLLSLLAIVALAAGYEALRSLSRRFELWVAKRETDVPSTCPPPPHMHLVPASCFTSRRTKS
jgi:solute carrier family 31 (copper transporter), member 1